MRTFPQDIECILEPINKKGGIYVSNIEAASNPSTLLSTFSVEQSMESEQ